MASKKKCQYWAKCYRKDKAHKTAFLHPGDGSESDTEEEQDDSTEQKISLVGKTVVFTGSLLGCTRAQAELRANTYGCLCSGVVSRNVNYVVIGEEAGSKAEKAKDLGIKTMTQSQWEKMLKSAKPHDGKRLTRSDSLNYNEDSDDQDKKDAATGKKKKVVKFDPKTKVLGGTGGGDSGDEGGEAKPKRKRVAHNRHDVSDSESDDDDQPSPPKKKKQGPPAAAATASTSSNTKRRLKCMFWKKCFRKNKDHRKEFCHPGDSDEDEAVEEMETDVDPASLPTAKNPMKDGESVTIEGKHQDYTIKHTGDTYYCTCYQWKMQTRAPNKRSCKHLKGHLGDKFEQARCGKEVVAGSEVITRGIRHKAIPQVLLANKWDKTSVNPTGWWLSEKLDGVRAYWDGKAFYSRLGNEFIPPSWFILGFPSDMTLDGELFGGRGKFQSTVSIVKTPGSGKWKDIKFHIFDAPSIGKHPFEERVATVTDYFKKNSAPYVHVLEHVKCRGVDHLKEEQKKVEGKGGEGLMIREPKSLYENRRSNTLLKIKTFHDAEARVISHEKGKGRNQFVCGALKCVMECGKKFKVGSGLTDADRRKPPKIGSIITYRFQEYTLDGVPRFPTFVGVRIDADEPKDAVLPKKPGQ